MAIVYDFAEEKRKRQNPLGRHYPDSGITIPMLGEIENEEFRREAGLLMAEMIDSEREGVIHTLLLEEKDIRMSIAIDGYNIFIDLSGKNGLGEKFLYRRNGEFMRSEKYFFNPQL